MMDSDKDLSSENPVSVLQGDKLFFDRIVSRESSVGCSSRFYYRIAEGVPFKWEIQPGKSKNPPPAWNEVVPPIRAPPALLSLGLPKPPCIDDQQQQRHNKGGSTSTSTTSAGSRGSRVWFWKKSKRNQLRKKLADSFKKHSNGFERPENSGFIYNSDVDVSMDSSSPRSSSSSSSFSSSNSNTNIDHSLPSSSIIHSPARDFIYAPFGCTPWNISAIMISVAKRV